MGELDQKSKDKAAKEERKRRTEVDDQEGSGDSSHLLPWDGDVEEFLTRLERSLNDFRTAMTSSEFRTVVLDYRGLSVSERRAATNRLQRRGLDQLVRSLHAGDFRMYTDGWQQDATVVRIQRGNTEPPSG